MSFERYPAKRLSPDAKRLVEFLTSEGLTVTSTVRVPHGMVAQHTVSVVGSGDSEGQTFISEAYTNDLKCFVAGYLAAQAKKPPGD